MALRAEALNFEPPRQNLAVVVQPSIKSERAPTEDHLSRFRRVATSFRRVATKRYRVIHDRAARSYSVIVEYSNGVVVHLRRQIQITREEHPLRIVALAAGTAFVLGIVLRVWRKQHE